MSIRYRLGLALCRKNKNGALEIGRVIEIDSGRVIVALEHSGNPVGRETFALTVPTTWRLWGANHHD